MLRFTPLRTVAALGCLIGLILIWPAVSYAWVGFVRGTVLLLSGGARSFSSPGASVLLPIVCAAIALIDIAPRRQAFWMGASVLLTFGLELGLVAVGAVTRVPLALVAIPGDAVQIMVPVGVLVLAITESRRGGSGRLKTRPRARR